MSKGHSLVAILVAALMPLSASPARAQSGGLVAAYGFEEPSGATATDTAGANPGTIAGATRSTAGRHGSALSFDGINDRVDIADSASLDLSSAMTLEAWVKPTTSNDWRTAILKERPGGLAYALYSSTDNNRPSTEISRGSMSEARGPSALPAGTWSHVAATFDGANLRLYVNGTAVSAAAAPGAITISSGALRLGGNAVWGEYFSGLLDEVRIYNRALSVGELQTDMNTPIVSTDSSPPTTPTLTATVQTGNDVLLTWTAATDNVGVTKYNVYRGSTLIAQRDATLSRQWLDFDQAPGTTTYRVVALDAANNGSAPATADATIAADTTPPSVALPGDCTGTKRLFGSHELAPTVADEYGATQVRLELDGQPLHTFSGGVLSYQWNTKTVADGVHTIRAIARDAAGNEGSATCQYKTYNPALGITVTPAQGSTVRGFITHTATVLGNGEPLPDEGWFSGSPVQQVEFSSPWGGSTNPVDTAYPYELGSQSVLWAGGNPRSVTIRATASIVGGTSVTTQSTFTVDNSLPAPTNLTATVIDGNDVKLTWTHTEDPWEYGIAGYYVYRDGVRIHSGVSTSNPTLTDEDVAPGTHHYAVHGSNGLYGGYGAFVDVTVGGDTTPPSVSLPGDCTGTKRVFGTHTLAPETSEDATQVRLELDGQALHTFSGGSSSYQWNTKAVADGAHTIKAIARDAAGNEAADECEYKTYNPDYTLTVTPAPGSTVRGMITHTATVLGDGEPLPNDGWLNGSPVQQVAFTPPWPGGGSPIVDTTFPYALTPWDSSVMGSHAELTIRATATITGSGTVSAESTFTADNSIPAPTGLTATVVDGDDVKLTWDPAPSGYGIAYWRVYRDGVMLTTATTSTTYTDANRAPGTYRYQVNAGNGRFGGAFATIDVTVGGDTTPPTLSFGCSTGPVRDRISWRPTYADDRGGVTLTVKVDGTTVYEHSGGGSPIILWDSATVANGTHTLTAVARDTAGNETAEPPCTFTVYNPQLQIPFVSPAEGATVSGEVLVKAQPQEDDAPISMTGTVDFTGAPGLGSVSGSGPFQRTWDTTKVPNGDYTLKAEASRGPSPAVQATSTRQVRVANIVPKPTGLTATVVGDGHVNLRWDAPPASAGVTDYKLYRDGVLLGFPSYAPQPFIDPSRPPGTHRYTLVARNGGLVESVASDEVVVTIDPPATLPGLVAAYAMDTAPGTATGAVPAAAGKFGGAFSFDGNGDYITIPDSNPFDLQPGMTLEAWVRPTRVDDWRTVLLKERPGQLAYALYASAEGGPWAEVTAGTQRHASTNTALPVNTWTHLAATYDAGTLRLYVNGTQVASVAVSGALFNSSGPLKIGGNGIWGEWFSGLIDEVRVYERALTGAEIQSDMARPVAGS